MTLDDVRRALAPQTEDLRARGVKALYVFGSVARGEAGPDSDVDMLIEIDPKASFSIIELAGLKDRLGKVLGVPADVHLRDGIHYWIRDDVLREAVPVL